MLWGIPISYGGFPYNMGDSHVIWVFPVVGNKGKKIKFLKNKIKSNQIKFDKIFEKIKFSKKKSVLNV